MERMRMQYFFLSAIFGGLRPAATVYVIYRSLLSLFSFDVPPGVHDSAGRPVARENIDVISLDSVGAINFSRSSAPLQPVDQWSAVIPTLRF